MSQQQLSLAHPPIVEAVLDIECDLPPGQRVEQIESAARDAYSDRYPEVRVQLVQEHQVEVAVDAPPVVSARGAAVGAYQFLDGEGKQLVQIRPQGFAFNRLAPYGGLDTLMPEIERTWQLYVTLAVPVQIRLIRLRYINRILLPLENGRLELDEYLGVGPKLPDEERLAFGGFLNQHFAVEKQTGNQVAIVLTTQPVEGDKLPLIFDNTVTAVESHEPGDWPWILQKLQALRDLKNHIFERTLTPKCLNLFR